MLLFSFVDMFACDRTQNFFDSRRCLCAYRYTIIPLTVRFHFPPHHYLLPSCLSSRARPSFISIQVANTASALGLLYAQQNTPGYDLARAVTCFEQVLEIREALQASESVDGSGGGGGGAGCAAAYHHLGVLHTDLGVAASDVDAAKDQFNEALAHFMKALKIRRSLGDAAERETASTLNNMAAVLHKLGKNEQCLSVYSKSLEIKRKLLLSTHPSIADTLYNMGALNLEMNRPGPASEYFVQALTISTTKLGMSHPLTADLQKQILTCDSLAAQQEGGGDSSSGHQDVRGGGGGAESLGLMGKDSLSSRLRLDRGLFASEYNRDRASSSGDGSANTVRVSCGLSFPVLTCILSENESIHMAHVPQSVQLFFFSINLYMHVLWENFTYS